MSLEVLAGVVEAQAELLLAESRQRAALELPEKIRDTAANLDYLEARVIFARLKHPGIPMGPFAAVLRQWADMQEQANFHGELAAAQPVAVQGGYL